MSSGASGEVVHCPNCNEDVPKTLYCLNCGFPLYKEEQPKDEAKSEQDMQPEAAKPIAPEEDAVIMVDEEKETPEAEADIIKPEADQSEPPVEAKSTDEPEAQPSETDETQQPELKEEAPAIEESTKPQVIAETKTEQVEESVPLIEESAKATAEVKNEPESSQEPAETEEMPMEKEVPSVIEGDEEPPAEPEAEAETPSGTEYTEEQKNAEELSEPSASSVKSSEMKAVEVDDGYKSPEAFIPDPLTKDLMENLAKNITLKLKLVKLYRDGAIKEETFTKLFDGYSSEGQIWYRRREEMLKKLADEIEEMEESNSEATEALELLEVKKSIGDVSSGEYAAKAPAYKWDIDNFDNLIGEKRNKTSYLENLSNILTEAELVELRELASVQYNTLESLQISNDELLTKIRSTLYEAIKTLG